MHIVSNVSGVMRKNASLYDAYRAIFPAGTVSGAPKVRAMELVAEMEPERRHIYAGSVGYVSFTGELDTCIAIRTIMIHEGKVYVQAGGGITYDSKETPEYFETINKLKATMRAIDRAGEGYMCSTGNENLPSKKKMKC